MWAGPLSEVRVGLGVYPRHRREDSLWPLPTSERREEDVRALLAWGTPCQKSGRRLTPCMQEGWRARNGVMATV